MDEQQYLMSVKIEHGEASRADKYPYSLAAISGLDTLELHPSVTFIVGENGSGKSTLLEAIAVAWGFNAEGGSQNFSFASRSSHSDLHKILHLKKGQERPRDGFFLRAESFFNETVEYTETEHYAVAKQFLNNHEKLLKTLMED